MPSTHVSSKFTSEILRGIFLECVRTAKPEDIQRYRTILRLVCRHWRQIVESYAPLWSTIYLSLRPRTGTLCPPASTVRLFLKRSMDAPLEIYVLSVGLLSPDQRGMIDRYTTTVFPLFVEQAFRWKRLVLDLEDKFANDLRSIAFAKAEWLRDVDIRRAEHHDWEGKMDIEVIQALADAPNLRSLKWRNGPEEIMQYVVKTFPLEWLVDLQLNFSCSMSLPDLLHVMQKCTSVVEMRISMEYCIYSTQDPPSPVTLPNLRTLEISLEVAEYDMLQYFDFPNLEILVVHWWGEDIDDDSDITPISHYLSNLRHSLQVLLVHDYTLSIEELATFLSDSAVLKIPVVQVNTRSLPDDIRDDILEAVETRLPDIQQAEFKINSGDEEQEEWERSAVMGWTNASTYEKFKDYFAGLDEHDILRCMLRP